MPSVGISELISLTNPELVKLGVPADQATALRERMTGHVRSLSDHWVRSVGHWGGVSTKEEIADVVGCDAIAVKNYSMRMRLRTKTKYRAATPAELAVACLVSMPRSAREAAPDLGLMPVEVALYRAAMTLLCDLNGVTLPQVLRWTCDDLEAAWATERLSIALGADEYVNFSDLDALDAIAAEAELLENDPEERARAKARRDADAQARGEMPPRSRLDPRVSASLSMKPPARSAQASHQTRR